MRIATRLGLVAIAAAVWVGTASGAAGPRIVEAGGTTYPDRAYILSLPSPKILKRSQVSVKENGGPVSRLAISAQGKTAIVIAIDASASMQGKPITAALAAARAFAARMTPNEQVSIVVFNKGVEVLQPFTTDKAQVKKALATVPSLAVGTKIYDALDQSLQQITASGSQDASIILLTDGTDVGSVATRADVLSLLRNQHVRVFTVGLDSKTFSPKVLSTIAAASNGAYVKASGPGQLKPIFETLGKRLSSEYVLQYRSHVNPNTHVVVSTRVAGVAGVALAGYKTPPLQIASAPPVNPSGLDRVVQSSYTYYAFAAVIATLLGFAVVLVVTRRDQPLVSRVGSFVAVHRAKSEASSPDVPRESLLSRVTARTSKSSWSARLTDTLELADIEADPVTFVLLVVVSTVLVMLLLGLLLGPLGFLAGLATPFFVRAFVLSRVSRKRRTFAEQLPDNLDVLASALRAGHSLVGALTVVANDATEPSRTEFQRVLADEAFGVQLEDAFKATVERMENQDIDQVALVARLQREMGSNSAEVLDRVIVTVRGRMELRRLVRTLTAQGRFSRWVLTALPIGIAVALSLVSSSYMHPLFHKPLGQLLLVLAIAMVAIGSWVIGKIVDIKV